jgi:hypothetical protein
MGDQCRHQVLGLLRDIVNLEVLELASLLLLLSANGEYVVDRVYNLTYLLRVLVLLIDFIFKILLQS